jgi:hypothetical protein
MLELPSYDEVVAMVEGKEIRRAVMSSQPIENPEAKAFVIHSFFQNPQNHNFGQRAERRGIDERDVGSSTRTSAQKDRGEVIRSQATIGARREKRISKEKLLSD